MKTTMNLIIALSLPFAYAQALSSGCVDNSQFHFVQQSLTFKDALQHCETTFGNGNGTLASIRNEAEFTFVSDFLDNNNVTDVFFIGLRRENAVDDAEDPLSFHFVDGFEDQSFFETPQVFPWSQREPNNIVPEQSCVVWNKGDSDTLDLNTWDDEQCQSSFTFLCRSSCLNLEQNESDVAAIEVQMQLLTAGVVLLTIALLLLLLLATYKRSVNNKRRLIREIDAMYSTSSGNRCASS